MTACIARPLALHRTARLPDVREFGCLGHTLDGLLAMSEDKVTSHSLRMLLPPRVLFSLFFFIVLRLILVSMFLPFRFRLHVFLTCFAVSICFMDCLLACPLLHYLADSLFHALSPSVSLYRSPSVSRIVRVLASPDMPPGTAWKINF